MQRLGQSRSVAGRMCRAVQRAACQSCLRCLHLLLELTACRPIEVPAFVPIPPLPQAASLPWTGAMARRWARWPAARSSCMLSWQRAWELTAATGG